jgi:hypothetical protein
VFDAVIVAAQDGHIFGHIQLIEVEGVIRRDQGDVRCLILIQSRIEQRGLEEGRASVKRLEQGLIKCGTSRAEVHLETLLETFKN